VICDFSFAISGRSLLHLSVAILNFEFGILDFSFAIIGSRPALYLKFWIFDLPTRRVPRQSEVLRSVILMRTSGRD
jgi:hypothetical protein